MNRTILVAFAAITLVTAAARASNQSDCHSTKEPAVALVACADIIANEQSDAKMRALAYAVRGKLYHRAGDFDTAIAELTRGIELDRQYAVLFSSRGASYVGKGDAERAIADFTEAIRLDPKDLEPFVNRAVIHFGANDHAHALADMDAAIRLAPKMAMLYTYRAKMHLDAGDAEKAAADFRQVLKLDPGNKEAAAMLSDLGMGAK